MKVTVSYLLGEAQWGRPRTGREQADRRAASREVIEVKAVSIPQGSLLCNARFVLFSENTQLMIWTNLSLCKVLAISTDIF